MEPPSCGIVFVSDFSLNELNQKQITQAITAPPDEVCVSAQRVFCPPWPQFLRKKKSVETKARLLAMPIVLTFLITNMVLLTILTPGGASAHSPTVL